MVVIIMKKGKELKATFHFFLKIKYHNNIKHNSKIHTSNNNNNNKFHKKLSKIFLILRIQEMKLKMNLNRLLKV
jgi:hypothetical protein